MKEGGRWRGEGEEGDREGRNERCLFLHNSDKVETFGNAFQSG